MLLAARWKYFAFACTCNDFLAWREIVADNGGSGEAILAKTRGRNAGIAMHVKFFGKIFKMHYEALMYLCIACAAWSGGTVEKGAARVVS